MAGWRIGDLYPFDEPTGRAALDAAIAFAREWHGSARGRITTMLGPQAPDMLSRELLLDTKRAADREGLMIHMHVAQGDREIDQMMKRYGQRSPAFLDALGYLDSQLLAVHLTEATDDEASFMAKRGTNMVLCSGSIGIIDGLVPPARAFREAGGWVALGSDQASGNNCNNIFNEMKLTALFNKIKHRSPTAMPAWEVLRMATIEGAKAIGLEDEIGSLEVGKQADFCLVDLTAANLSPVLTRPIRNIVPNLVYAASGYEIQTVVIAGKLVVHQGKVLTVDEHEIRAEAQHEAKVLGHDVASDPTHKDMDLMPAMDAGLL
jgi:5-methylthioadenosine/S-adenosylhomocysteine deaminase